MIKEQHYTEWHDIPLYNQCKHCTRYYGDNYKSESGDNQ